MKRRTFLVAVLAMPTLAAPAHAAGVDDIVDGLKNAGYSDVRVSRTLLGRIRIDASGGGLRRQIVVNRGTGEILRDFTAREPSPADRPSSAGTGGRDGRGNGAGRDGGGNGQAGGSGNRSDGAGAGRPGGRSGGGPHGGNGRGNGNGNGGGRGRN